MRKALNKRNVYVSKHMFDCRTSTERERENEREGKKETLLLVERFFPFCYGVIDIVQLLICVQILYRKRKTENERVKERWRREGPCE